ncbi:uncharacterized protein YaaR (DUF327 family) [Oikeobacillus pervagus]|uniref:Uncharacterized protein YaaR (DUF327 family) n=1 Tax=Oikeobacillus pervagus TaxID=1325931 RepID=A0AAJ1T0F4_9BACI|nr:YaaR family protein [Oikeobacillus pervagus]MDQ0216218.1 uncharacterized protein YaaR (DUF327 family) [Oikeobacillus pervagus]
MKINQDLRVGVDQVRSEHKHFANNKNQFGLLVQEHDQKMKTEQLGKLLGDIEGAGNRLARSRTFQDLAKYKTLVKRFIRETVEYGMGLKQSHTWNHFGEGRQLKTVEKIDEKLIELTDTMMNKEKKSMDILEQIGEIKGLLINLYT